MEFKKKEELSRFDKTRIIAARAHQIADGASLKREFSKEELEEIKYNPIKIALKEFEENLLNIQVLKSEEIETDADDESMDEEDDEDNTPEDDEDEEE